MVIPINWACVFAPSSKLLFWLEQSWGRVISIPLNIPFTSGWNSQLASKLFTDRSWPVHNEVLICRIVKSPPAKKWDLELSTASTRSWGWTMPPTPPRALKVSVVLVNFLFRILMLRAWCWVRQRVGNKKWLIVDHWQSDRGNSNYRDN